MPRCAYCGRENPDYSFYCSSCGESLRDSTVWNTGVKAQVAATLIASQDHITWLAFSLAMTTEALLLIGFFELEFGPVNLQNTPSIIAHMILPASGIFLAMVFRNMVNRSNADMGALYNKGEALATDVFHIPSRVRKGGKAGELMNHVLLTWAASWGIALFIVATWILAGILSSATI